MAGPLIPKGLLDYFDPSQASVLDSTPVSILRKLGGMMSSGDPGSDAISTVSPMATPAAPLISIYKNAAERLPHTQAFAEAGRRLGGPFGDAAAWFAQRYPRVAAHMELSPEPIRGPLGDRAMAQIAAPVGQVQNRIPMEVFNYGRARAQQNPGLAKDIIAHEGTHVAQALGNRNNRELYQSATELAGYANNPMEVSARMKGLSTYAEGGPRNRPYSALQGLREVADQSAQKFPQHEDVRIINEILSRRGAR